MEEDQKEEEVQAQFVDPASASLMMWLLKSIIGSIVWTVISFFTKLGLGKFWKKDK